MAICVVVLADQAAADQLTEQLNDPQLRLSTVSYTHLTLQTICSV